MGQKRKPKNTVFFEEEVVRREDAANILNELRENREQEEKRILKQSPQDSENSQATKSKNKRGKAKKRQIVAQNESELQSQQSISNNEHLEDVIKIKKRRKNSERFVVEELNTEVENVHKKVNKLKKSRQVLEHNEDELSVKKSRKRKSVDATEDKDEDASAITDKGTEQSQTSLESVKSKPTESKRSLKRKKHEKLLEEKKIKTDLKMKENALNYVSKWKHARSEWKFEKLKQIWLQQNLFAVEKIPEEFWQNIVDYFNGSRGAIRNAILSEALKIIEHEDKTEEQNDDDNYQTRLKRARDMVQSLEE